MTPDYAELAKHVVEYLRTAVPIIGAGFGTGLGKATGEKLFKTTSEVWTWLRGRFTRPADRGALEQVEQDPGNPHNWEDLADSIRRALERDPAFREELLALLPPEFRAPNNTQTATTVGDRNVTIQNQGGATISVNRP